MRIRIELNARHLLGAAVIVAASVVVAVWWASPARSAAAPSELDTFAFVARADNPVDALAASSVAGQLGAPVYLTFPDTLDSQAAAGLVEADPDVVVLAGGTVALSETVEQQIASLVADAEIRRMAGANRTETARLVNELTGDLGVHRPVVAGGTVTGDVGVDGTLTVADTDVAATLQRLGGRIDVLESDLAAADGRIAQLEATLDGVSRSGDTLLLSGMNVQLVNGEGATRTVNGLGNLIIGYSEDHTSEACVPSDSDCQYRGDGAADDRTGSHNIIVGVDHSWTSYGGLLGGANNAVSGFFASATGGRNNVASGKYASVAGGSNNEATHFAASATGGHGNVASASDASVTGGTSNVASGSFASVTGGALNIASDSYTSVTGGRDNTASFVYASVTGGFLNHALGLAASVSGGQQNSASALYTSVTGGNGNIASGENASVSGGADNLANSPGASVSGGFNNTASATRASVLGGVNNTADGLETTVAGGENGTVTDDYDSLIGDQLFPD